MTVDIWEDVLENQISSSSEGISVYHWAFIFSMLKEDKDNKGK